jgi:hypothetical protein
MTLNIHLPADVERTIRERASAAGVDLETYVTNIVKEEIAVAPEVKSPVPPPSSYAERLQAWIALHPVLDHPIDDSRESIYAGRGE